MYEYYHCKGKPQRLSSKTKTARLVEQLAKYNKELLSQYIGANMMYEYYSKRSRGLAAGTKPLNVSKQQVKYVCSNTCDNFSQKKGINMYEYYNHGKGKSRGLTAGTKKSKLAGQLAKYTRALINNNLKAKKEARDEIARMVGI